MTRHQIDLPLKIHLANGTTNLIQFNETTDFDSIVCLIVSRLSAEVDRPLQCLLAFRLCLSDSSHVWFGGKELVCDVYDKFDLKSNQNKLELRVRYFAFPFKEIFYKDRVTFYYIYDQVKSDYVQSTANVDTNLAVQLACLEIHRLFKDVTNFAIDKKSNFEYLEKEIGLHKFFPASVITTTKSKQLRKLMQTEFKAIASLDELQCMLRFLDKVHSLTRFTEERYKCEFGSSWSVPVQLVLGPNVGISFQSDSVSDPTQMATFQQVQSLLIRPRPETFIDSNKSPRREAKCLLQLTIAGAQEMLSIICSSIQQAEQIAELIDSYCQIIQRLTHSIWTRTVSDTPELTEVPMIAFEKDYAEILEEDEDDEDNYCSLARLPPAHLQLDRQRVHLLNVIGEGQFGNVFRAEYESPDTNHPQIVAVKTCKEAVEEQHGVRFIQEANSMSHLHHPHIIELIGVCVGKPTWLVIEHAPLGQLRTFLYSVRPAPSTLLLYAQQLCDALQYLESQRFVHRDIAARNLLVFTPECIKLADFGLSRLLHFDKNYYKAGRGKMPVKWMAPESINYRTFSSSSDVWMFAVCLWEIFNLGAKPFPELKNSEVVQHLECGHRLPALPSFAGSEKLYKLMLQCWSYSPFDRPTFSVLKQTLNQIVQPEQDEDEEEKTVQLSDSLQAISLHSNETPNTLSVTSSNSIDQSLKVKATLALNIDNSYIHLSEPDSSLTQSDCSDTCVSDKNHNSIPTDDDDDVDANKNHSDSNINPSKLNDTFSNEVEEEESAIKRKSYAVPNFPTDDVLFDTIESNSSKDTQISFQDRLQQQQRQSAADAKWLQEEERLMFGSNQGLSDSKAESLSRLSPDSLDSNESPTADQSNTGTKSIESQTSETDQHDPIYVQTTQVLLAIKRLVEAVQQRALVRYLRLVQDVGAELRQLFTLVDNLMPDLPDWCHREIEMANKVLASDMSCLVRAMQQALANQLDTVSLESRKAMCQAAHTIVVDSKTLLDTVNSVRKRASLATFDSLNLKNKETLNSLQTES